MNFMNFWEFMVMIKKRLIKANNRYHFGGEEKRNYLNDLTLTFNARCRTSENA